MSRFLTGLAAIVSASMVFSTSPALAGFKIAKPQPKPPVKSKFVQPRRTALLGIDPALMEEEIVAANYSASLTRDPAARTAVIQATDGKTGWRVNFKDCTEESRCHSMEFYALWPISNEANVCEIWNNDVTKDPTRALGKPYCFTVPALEKQFHLILSSEQTPYLGMESLPPPQARERMQSMIGVWSTYLAMLPQAWEIASTKCPRTSDKCT